MGFGYDLDRSDFVKLISIYSGLFIMAYFLIEKYGVSFKVLASLGIVFRMVFIFSTPNLSQDFYRFIWDGRLVAQGISPYLFTPEMYFKEISLKLGIVLPQAKELLEGMGPLSASNFSNYPPVNQLFFATAGLFAGKSIFGSILILRVLIIMADVGTLYFGKKLLEKLNLPIKNIFWYFLNPFIIIELTGNLHFEGVMIFFFVLALYLLFKGKWFWAAILIGISVSVKLIPLLFLPLFIKYFVSKDKITNISLLHRKSFGGQVSTYEFSFKQLFAFYTIITLTVLLTFLPFLSSEFIENFASTIGLWFQNFEFNASIYYIIRWIGFQVVGWNIIETVGKVLPIIILLFVLGITFLRKNKTPQQLMIAMLFAISFYLLLSTTVHPWYIATPLLLSVFTKYKFPIVWSFMAFLSYSAYGKDGFDENLWLVALEYFTVISLAIWEIWNSKDFFISKNIKKGF